MKTGFGALAVVVCLAGLANAAPADGAATALCQGQLDTARGLATSVFGKLRSLHRRGLPGPGGKALRDRQVAGLVMKHVAAERFTAEVLRKPWARADDVFRARWPLALGVLLHRRFVRALNNPLRYDLTVGEVTLDETCKEARVHVSLTERKRRRVARLQLRLEYREGGWRVWDVMAKNVSFVQTWRARFARTATNYEGLVGLDRELGILARRHDVDWPPLPPKVEPADVVVQEQEDTH